MFLLNKKFKKNLKNIVRLFKLLWKASPTMTLAGILLRVFRALQALAALYVGKLIIDEIVKIRNHHADTSRLWELFTIEVILSVLLVIGFKIGILIEKLQNEQFTKFVSLEIISHTSTLDLQYFENPFFYDKLYRSSEGGYKRLELISGVLNQFQSLTLIIFLSIGLIASDAWFIIFIPLLVLPAFFGEKHFSHKFYSLYNQQTSERRELSYYYWLGTTASSAKEIRIFDLSDFIYHRLNNLYTKFYESLKQLSFSSTLWMSLLAIFGNIGYYSIYAFILTLTIKGKLTLGEMMFLTASYRQLSAAMESFLSQFNSIIENGLYVKDFFDFFELKSMITTNENPIPFPNPIKKGFVFQNVCFKYLGSETIILKNINLIIGVGEKLALVGENGSGKTTLIKLLSRLYDPTEGQILLDGIDLRLYNLDELRQNIGIIFQDYIKYEMSISDNIAVGNIKKQFCHDEILEASKRSQVDDLVAKHTLRYDTLLGRSFHEGVELSGGEWQRIAIARAYMSNAQLLILDEPTSALDAKLEYFIFKRFSELSKNVSAIFISHKFSTVRLADRIVVLENGQITETGSHKELLLKNGKYAELFHLQAIGYY